MNKKTWIIISIIIVLAIGIGIWIYLSNTNSNDENSYNANKTSATNETTSTNQTNTLNTTNVTEETKSISEKENATIPPTPQEEQLATFTTKIYSQDSARQNNINITCQKLNGTIVKNGETFSFCSTVGQSSTAKGYQEADIFDNQGNKKKGLGGGNCQISTTLYNTVLAVPSLTVTERHKHSNYVPYVKKDKDAAVAYGSYDFKFKNNSGNDIKILSDSDGKTVTTTLLSIK